MATEALRLRRETRVSRSDGKTEIAHLDVQMLLEGGASELFAKMLPHLDGTRDLESMARELGESPARLDALARRLLDAGVVTRVRAADGTTAGEMSGREFHALHRRWAQHWLRPVYAHPLWSEIASGAATRSQVLGFAFEKYHYIEAAHEHMGIAAANATPELMPHLARHFIEEYAHGDIYRGGLRRLFSDSVVLASQPIPSTRALVNLLNETAARSSFAYYAGNEVLQLTENTSDPSASGAIDSFYDAMRAHYPFTGPLVESFIAHTKADQRLGHEDVFGEMCGSVPPLSPREVRDALNVARSMAEHLALFLDGIRSHYARFPAIPRTPCELPSE